MVLVGCAGLSGSRENKMLSEAEVLFENGDYYLARKKLGTLLFGEGETKEAAEALMAQILDKEIERQKDYLAPKAVVAEEMNEDESAREIKTWIERSRELLRTQQYDLALFAAEKVFLYDAENLEASGLIDDIKREALSKGKAESLFLTKMYEEEIAERISSYKDKAEELFKAGRIEQAKFMLRKVLLLEPEHTGAMSLYERILETGRSAS